MTSRHSLREVQSQERPQYDRDRGKGWGLKTRPVDSEASADCPGSEAHSRSPGMLGL